MKNKRSGKTRTLRLKEGDTTSKIRGFTGTLEKRLDAELQDALRDAMVDPRDRETFLAREEHEEEMAFTSACMERAERLGCGPAHPNYIRREHE